MTDVPKDIEREAFAVLQEIKNLQGEPSHKKVAVIARALLAERERRTFSPGWPDPLESPQAEAIRPGKIDDVEIRNLFDQMEREIQVHRKAFCERRTSDVVTDEWAEAYCALVNRHPDGSQTTFMSDGPVTITFREMAKREIAAMLAAAPSLSSGAGGGERG